ncbi:MAG TPA: glycosyltransferase [Vulgatibacter sp.]|nr:glycosyltransferase [Vulgatibacter sp.]
MFRPVPPQTTRVREVPIRRTTNLDLYRVVDHLDAAVAELREMGRRVSDSLGRNRVWMVSSTVTGGGVAESMPRACSLLTDLGVDTRWLVLEPGDPSFFTLTKSLHNMLHGVPGTQDLEAARSVYERVSAEAAAEMRQVDARDILVIHDPQPAGIALHLRRPEPGRLAWRCHVGIPERNEHTNAAWSFLRPYLGVYDRLLFTLMAYVPDEWLDRSGELCPGIDPFSHKNRPLRPYKLLGILRSAGLIPGPSVPRWARFRAKVQRWIGKWDESPLPSLLYCPTILQVSRFDRLKGFESLLPAFELLTRTAPELAASLPANADRVKSEIERAHLVLAGPDPSGVADDPEAEEVLDDLCRRHDRLPSHLKERVHVMRLPMVDVKENALIVNALQRVAAVVVQNSIREGFGLTVSEALWKRAPVAASNVGGLARQIRHGSDGVLIDDPRSPESIAAALLELIASPMQGEAMARSGRERVSTHFTVLSEIKSWLLAFSRLLEGADPAPSPDG